MISVNQADANAYTSPEYYHRSHLRLSSCHHVPVCIAFFNDPNRTEITNRNVYSNLQINRRQKISLVGILSLGVLYVPSTYPLIFTREEEPC